MSAIQTQVSFFACPSTGQVLLWDPPVGNFECVLMPTCLGYVPHGDTAMKITSQREWQVVGDWRRIPWRHSILISHKDWQNRMGKARWICHTINGPPSTCSLAVDSPRFQFAAYQNTALGRRLSKSIPSATDQSPSRATAQEQRPVDQRSRSHTKEARGPSQAPRLNPLQAVSPPQRRRAKLLPLCGAMLLLIPTDAACAPAHPWLGGAPPTPTPSHRPRGCTMLLCGRSSGC
jgi:hypothetical protein